MRKLATRKMGAKALIENLETRRFLAGNVTAALDTSGVLIVTGDNKANQFEVSTDPGPDRTEVTPLGDTRINGGTAPVVFAGFPDVVIATGNGDDFVRLRDFTIQDVDVSTGSGNDVVVGDIDDFGGNIFNDLSIDTGNGDDSVTLTEKTQILDLSINTGNGDDAVSLLDDTVVFGNLSIQTGNGADEIAATGQFVVLGTATFDGGHGHDTLDESGITFFAFGSPPDIIAIETVVV